MSYTLSADVVYSDIIANRKEMGVKLIPIWKRIFIGKVDTELKHSKVKTHATAITTSTYTSISDMSH